MVQKKKNSNQVIVQYVNHASFLINYKKTSLLIDPFFSGRFFWQNHIEIQISKPGIKISDLPKIDAVLCTHIHGDHFDLNSILKLVKRDDCLIFGPPDVIESCSKQGLDKGQCLIASVKKPVQIKDVRIVFLPNKGYEDEKVCNKLSLVIECGAKNIFHSGDSHGHSKMWNRYNGKINLACLWCVETIEIIEKLQPKSVVLHHFESFSPGDFSCNIDVSEMLESLRKKFNKVHFFDPVRQNTFIL